MAAHQPPTAAGSSATVTATDIARLAGVGRAAVSNWRRRFADFPPPVAGTSTSPLFALTAVEDWFGRHDRPFRVEDGDRVWQQVRGAVDDPRLGELVGHLGGFLLHHQQDRAAASALLTATDETAAQRLGPAILRAVPELPDGFPVDWEVDWVPIARSAAAAADRRGHAALFAVLRERYREVYSREVAQPPAAVAELMARLAGLHGPEHPPGSPSPPSSPEEAGGERDVAVLDSACGVGGLLEAARAAGARRLLGQDLHPTMARVTAAGLLLGGADARIIAADSLLADAFPGERADAVLCAPPFGQRSWGYDELLDAPWWRYGLPSRGEPELAWVQHCLAHARAGAPVLVIMPSAAASRRAGRRIRANLLRAGALRAVLELPPDLFGAGSPPDLWVLRSPEAAEAEVRGAEGAEPVPSEVLMGLATTDLADVEAAWSAFLAAGVAGAAAPTRVELPPGFQRVRIAELLDDEVDVNPRRRVEPYPGKSVDRPFPALRAEFLDALSELTSAVPTVSRPGQSTGAAGTRTGYSAASVTGGVPVDITVGGFTVGDLVKAGALAILTAPLQTRAGDGVLPMLTAQDVRLGRDASGRTGDLPGMLALQPGDVVCVVAAGDFSAQVIDGAGAVLGPRLSLLRVDPGRLDPHFLAGSLRAGAYREGGRSGPGEDGSGVGRSAGSSPRTDLRRIRIPDLPLTDQRARADGFRRLMRVEQALRTVAELGEHTLRAGYLDLAAGSVRATGGVGTGWVGG